MDTDTSDLYLEKKTIAENVLLNIIKEVCSEPSDILPPLLIEKTSKLIADCDLFNYSSLHKTNTASDNIATLLAFQHRIDPDLTFEDHAQLIQAILTKIHNKIPVLNLELDKLKQNIGKGTASRKNEIKELQESLDAKLNALKEQENEKVELMVEWLNHRLQEVSTFSSNSNELLTLRTRILELKSKILHLQILRNIYTETNQSIKAYSEIQKDLKDSIKETEQRIRNFKDIIESDYN